MVFLFCQTDGIVINLRSCMGNLPSPSRSNTPICPVFILAIKAWGNLLRPAAFRILYVTPLNVCLAANAINPTGLPVIDSCASIFDLLALYVLTDLLRSAALILYVSRTALDAVTL